MKQNPPSTERLAPGTTSVQGLALSAEDMSELFQQFASAERHVLWVIDLLPREKVHYVSPAFETLWGIAAEALYADSRLWLGPIHADDRPAVVDAFTRWAEAPLTQAFDIEYRLVRPDGSQRWVHTLGHPPLPSRAHLRRCTGITEDITERMRAAEALLAEQQRLETIAAVAPITLCSFRRNLFGLLSVPYGGARVAALFGAPGAALEKDGSAVWERIHPDDLPHINEQLDESSRTLGTWRAEFRVRLDDGSVRWLEGLATPAAEGQGSFLWHGSLTDVTQRKLADEALRAEKDRVSAIIATAPTIVTSFHRAPDGRAWYELGAERVAELMGVDAAELRHDARAAFERNIAPDDLVATRQAALRSAQELIPWRTEFRVAHPTRGELWLEGHAIPRRQPDDSTAWYGTLTDATERKLALEALRAETERMAAIIATAPSIVNSYHASPDGRVWYELGVERVAALIGASEAQLRSDARPVFEQLVPPEDSALAQAASIRSARDLTPWCAEFRVRHASRGELWLEGHAIPRRQPDGSTAWYGVLTDITERKRTEQALTESQRRLKAVVASMTEGLILASPDGSINEWNPAALALHGLGGTSVQALSMAESAASFEVRTLGGDRLPLRRWPISRLLAGESLQQAEFRLRRTDIEWERVMSYSGTRVDDAEGRPQFALLQCSDVTERHRTEEEVVRLNAGLEKRVAERTAELQAAVKEIEAFSYSVSHDLRAPLRALDGFSQVLIEDHGKLLPEEGRRYLGIIRGTAQKMGHLIDDLLAFSRLGRQALTRRRINCPQLVLSVFESLAPQRNGRQIEWRMGELPDCDADLALLRQVWINLLGNAIKYTGQTPQAVIEVGSHDQGGSTEYFVRDNGAGFDMKYVHKLFGVFERLHRADEFEGTGVGLAIVQRIVQRHGGQVRAEGEVGHGATFYFTLN